MFKSHNSVQEFPSPTNINDYNVIILFKPKLQRKGEYGHLFEITVKIGQLEATILNKI